MNVDILAAIHEERERQEALWDGRHTWGYGSCSSPGVTDTVKATVLAEECGEVARAVLERDTEQLRRELVQVAAVAIAWLECLTSSESSVESGRMLRSVDE